MIDPKAFRQTLGRFATGITIITVGGEDFQGMTANAVSSVSLSPPLVSVALSQGTRTLEAALGDGSFVVNILAEGQVDLCRHFAIPCLRDRFNGIAYRPGKTGAPILDGNLAELECRVWNHFPAGDHTIVVGEVYDLAIHPGQNPLLFYQGGYHILEAEPLVDLAARFAAAAGDPWPFFG